MRFDVFGYTIEIDKRLTNAKDIPDELLQALKVIEKYSKTIEATPAQKKAADIARQTKSKKTKEKILNAIALLKLEGKNLSEYAIAKTSGCSINTIKKYRDFINKLK